MNSAKSLFHSWVKKWGGDLAFHEEEIIRDINYLIGQRISECNKVTLDFMAKNYRRNK